MPSKKQRAKNRRRNTENESDFPSGEDSGLPLLEGLEQGTTQPGDSDATQKPCIHAKGVKVQPLKKKLAVLTNDSCMTCAKEPKSTESAVSTLWICLHCGKTNCEGFGHAEQHFRTATSHFLACSSSDGTIWCHGCGISIDPDAQKQQILKECSVLVRKAVENAKSQVIPAAPVYVPLVPQPVQGKKQRQKETARGNMSEKKEKANVQYAHPTGRRKSSVVPGFTNLGNTCFFNSVMQVVTQTDRFVHSILTNDQLPDTPLFFELRIFLQARSIHGGGGVLSPRGLFNAVSRRWRQYKGMHQQDSHELLRFLLDGLRDDEIKKSRDAVDSKSPQSAVIDTCFKGRLASVIVCDACKSISLSSEPFFDLSVPIPSIVDHRFKTSNPKSVEKNILSRKELRKEQKQSGKNRQDHPTPTLDMDIELPPSEPECIQTAPTAERLSLINSLLSGMSVVSPESKLEGATKNEYTLTDCIKRFVAVETLEGANSFACRTCGVKEKEKCATSKSVKKEAMANDGNDTEDAVSPLASQIADVVNLSESNDVSLSASQNVEVNHPSEFSDPVSPSASQNADVTQPSEFSDVISPSVSQNDSHSSEFFEAISPSASPNESQPSEFSDAISPPASQNVEIGHPSEFSDPKSPSASQNAAVAHPSESSGADDVTFTSTVASMMETDGTPPLNISKAETQLGDTKDEVPKENEASCGQDDANSVGGLRRAYKRYLIAEAPPVLVCHLKRFQANEYGRVRKVNEFVQFDEWLDLELVGGDVLAKAEKAAAEDQPEEKKLENEGEMVKDEDYSDDAIRPVLQEGEFEAGIEHSVREKIQEDDDKARIEYTGEIRSDIHQGDREAGIENPGREVRFDTHQGGDEAGIEDSSREVRSNIQEGEHEANIGQLNTGDDSRPNIPEGAVLQSEEGGRKIRYRLYGVVVHQGRISGGHYVAYIRVGSKSQLSKGECGEEKGTEETTKKVRFAADVSDELRDRRRKLEEQESREEGEMWVYASDEHVRCSSIEEVLRCEAYLLFYAREEM